MHYEQKKRPFRKQRQVELDRAIHLKKKKRFGGPKRLWHPRSAQQQVAAQTCALLWPQLPWKPRRQFVIFKFFLKMSSGTNKGSAPRILPSNKRKCQTKHAFSSVWGTVAVRPRIATETPSWAWLTVKSFLGQKWIWPTYPAVWLELERYEVRYISIFFFFLNHPIFNSLP